MQGKLGSYQKSSSRHGKSKDWVEQTWRLVFRTVMRQCEVNRARSTGDLRRMTRMTKSILKPVVNPKLILLAKDIIPWRRNGNSF